MLILEFWELAVVGVPQAILKIPSQTEYFYEKYWSKLTHNFATLGLKISHDGLGYTRGVQNIFGPFLFNSNFEPNRRKIDVCPSWNT